MKLPIDGPDFAAASALIAIFVLPSFVHMVLDLASRPGRNFSVIVNKLRHVLLNLLRLGLIVGAGAMSQEIAGGIGRLIFWGALAAFLAGAALVGATDRRLTIDGTTGLVKWGKISLPWWPAKTTFIDQVSLMKLTSDKNMSVLGIGKLARFYTASYNGNVSTSGHSTKQMLGWMAEQVNDYIEAFRRHDSKEGKTRRAEFRKHYKAARAPQRRQLEARKERAKKSESHKARERAAKKKAKKDRKEAARRRKADDKFR